MVPITWRGCETWGETGQNLEWLTPLFLPPETASKG